MHAKARRSIGIAAEDDPNKGSASTKTRDFDDDEEEEHENTSVNQSGSDDGGSHRVHDNS